MGGTRGTVVESVCGRTQSGRDVRAFTLRSAADAPVEVTVLTLGATVSALRAPDRAGRLANIVLGFAGIEGYERPGPFFGCIVGRYANRIAGAAFALEGVTHRLEANDGEHHLHGGLRGFDKAVWEVEDVSRGPDAVGVVLRRMSRAGEGGPAGRAGPARTDRERSGYPGNLDVRVAYALDAGNGLAIRCEATTDAPTVVNLSNHTYWNLAGEGSGHVDDHLLAIAASRYTPVDATLIPTGEIAPVDGTPLDFRRPTRIGDRVRLPHPQLLRGRGIDHNWVLDRASPDDEGAVVAAILRDPGSGRVVRVLTTEPGIQVYTGNFLDGTLRGPSGRAYRQGDGIALETQHFPDSPNQRAFPSTVLRPGETYRTTTVFELGVEG